MNERETLRRITMTKIGEGRFMAHNRRGGVLPVGSGDDPDFTPVELFLSALAGCGAIDVELITGKRAAATSFEVTATGDKIRDDQGNHLKNLKVSFDIVFPDDEGGDQARDVLPRTLEQVRDRLCTVSRTVAIGEYVELVSEA